jgi:hypothetical protein
VLLCVLSGVLGLVQVAERSAAAEDVATRSAPLGVRTQELYRALADADATAAAALLGGGIESPETRARFQAALDQAGRSLAEAAPDVSGAQARHLATVSRELPHYAQLVERARAANRGGQTVGGSWQRTASKLMRDTLLPAAFELHQGTQKRLRADHDRATAVPWPAIGAAAAVVVALVAAQVLLARRTRRILNIGLVLATAAMLASGLWLVAGLAGARADLDRSRGDGWGPMEKVAQARFATLQAYGDEGLTLVMRGIDNNEYEDDQQRVFADLVGSADGAGDGGVLAEAARLSAGDKGTRARIEEATRAVRDWRTAHGEVLTLYGEGRFADAVAAVIGPRGPSRVAFDRADAALADAARQDQEDFERAVASGRDGMAGIGVGAAVLAAVAALGVVDGIRRRVGEYR